jgi:hypothetical protein
VEHANKVTIRGNDVRIHPDLPKKGINTPIIDVTPDSTGVTIIGNTAHDVPSKAGWSVSGNKIVSGAGSTGASPGPVTVDKGPSGGASGGGSSAAGDDGTTFRFVGSKSKGHTDKIGSVDFADGDRIILQDYATGTLKGQGGGNPLAVNKVGTYAVLDSQADLSELAAASAAVKLTSSGGNQVLSITQGGSRHDIHLSGVSASSSSGSSGAASKASASASADGTDFRFTGSMAKAGKNAAPGNFDFADGDRIILQGFANGTLKGWGGGNPLAVNKIGTYAVLDSLADVQELAGASSAVSTRVKGDTLVIDLDPRGGAEIHLAGLGHDFLALQHPGVERSACGTFHVPP